MRPEVSYPNINGNTLITTWRQCYNSQNVTRMESYLDEHKQNIMKFNTFDFIFYFLSIIHNACDKQNLLNLPLLGKLFRGALISSLIQRDLSYLYRGSTINEKSIQSIFDICRILDMHPFTTVFFNLDIPLNTVINITGYSRFKEYAPFDKLVQQIKFSRLMENEKTSLGVFEYKVPEDTHSEGWRVYQKRELLIFYINMLMKTSYISLDSVEWKTASYKDDILLTVRNSVDSIMRYLIDQQSTDVKTPTEQLVVDDKQLQMFDILTDLPTDSKRLNEIAVAYFKASDINIDILLDNSPYGYKLYKTLIELGFFVEYKTEFNDPTLQAKYYRMVVSYSLEIRSSETGIYNHII